MNMTRQAQTRSVMRNSECHAADHLILIALSIVRSARSPRLLSASVADLGVRAQLTMRLPSFPRYRKRLESAQIPTQSLRLRKVTFSHGSNTVVKSVDRRM